MKILFDFDDILFDSASFKQTIFLQLESFGISEREGMSLYQKCRSSFSLRKIYKETARQQGFLFSEDDVQKLYSDVFSNITTCLNVELLTLIKEIGKENCYILSAGDEDFQKLKMKSSGLLEHIAPAHVTIVRDSKKYALKAFCEKYPGEIIIFVDDKELHVEEAVSLGIPTLYSVLFDKNGIDTLKKCIVKHRN